MPINKESFFISRFPDTHIGDDGAVVGRHVYSMDAFFENVHFKRGWMSLYHIARKAMLINLSDALAMNAEPRYALLSVAIPSGYTLKELEELARGFEETAAEFGVRIIGGDTIANIKLDISVTIVSETTAPLSRRGIRPGDLIAYTGDLGRSGRDLRRLLRGGSVHSRSRFVSPTLRRRFLRRAGTRLRAGMDISDGLGIELGRLSRLNRIDFRMLKAVRKSQLCSGEEYEMLIAFPAHRRREILRLAEKTRTPLTILARCRRGSYRSRCKATHF